MNPPVVGDVLSISAAWHWVTDKLKSLTRAALERAEEKILEDARPALDNVVSLTGRRLWPSTEALLAPAA
jgi:hypothetical protein